MHMRAISHPSLGKVFIWILSFTSLARAAEPPLDFNRDIRPILSENCFACHGFDEKSRQANLRLDDASSATATHDGKAAIVPGDLSKSELWMRITSSDEDLVMPPKKANRTLRDVDRMKIKRWIEEGATFAGHWAFITPKKLDLPIPKTNPIDAWIDHRLSQVGLHRSPRASRETLIRRLTLDLTGLPPSTEEVDAFVQDKSPNAYAQLVDRLLNSPHFGERVALDWLDAARYADTNGFSIDGGRHMWLWRDWVIQAFNDNKPYDRFLVEQIAGDLLPGGSDAEKIATGFQRNNMVTHEGGTIPDENLVNYNADRVKTFGEAVLGLTLGCAQCHDHKFDPIKQREYYEMFAFFNSLSDKGLDGNAGVNPGPSLSAKTVLRTNELPELEKRISILESTMKQRDDGLLKAWEEREQRILTERGNGFKLLKLQLKKVSTPNRGSGFEIDEPTNRIRLENFGSLGAIDVVAELPSTNEPIAGIRMTVLPQKDLPGGGWGFGPDDLLKKKAGKTNGTPSIVDDQPIKGSFMLTALCMSAGKVPTDQVNLFRLLPIQTVSANSFQLSNPPTGCLDPRNESGWSPDLKDSGPVRLTATLNEPLKAQETPYVTIQLNFGHGKSLYPNWIELHAFTGRDDDTYLPPATETILRTPAEQRSKEQVESLWQYCAAHTSELERERIELANLKERRDVLTKPFTTMVMDVSPKPRETFVLHRGDYSKRGDKVEAGTLSVLPKMQDGLRRDRLGLAYWVVQKDHPLTARVAVNRFWKMIFGRGIVGTASDFGSQGDWPTHPELLDWLSVHFVEGGWNVKELFRLIVMSEIYQQSSNTNSEVLERDPQNLLLARGSRYRLPAELIRDNALKTSGLLVPRIGGPSVNPYMPGDLWREVSHYGSSPATSQTFVQDHGEKIYRRSIYTYWKRTAPPPNMTAFDATNREVCTIARGNTTTPLQALVTLNDPQFVEASRAFATRILTRSFAGESSHDRDEQRMAWAFRETTSRNAKPAEMAVLLTRLQRERDYYTANPSQATQFLQVGESPCDASLDKLELAAWSQVTTLLLNLSETITRN